MLNQLLSSSMRIVADLEVGQSERFLSNGMKELGDERSLQTRVVLLGWGRDAIASILAIVLPKDLSKSQYEQLIPTSPVANEIEFGERCSLLAPKQIEFNSTSDLMEAIKELKLEKSHKLHGILASIPIDKASIPPARIVIAPPMEILTTSPIAVSTLTQNSAWLVIVDNDKEPTPKELSVLNVISSQMLSITTISSGGDAWSQKLEMPVNSQSLTPDNHTVISTLFNSFAQDGSALRQCLSDWHRRSKLEDFLNVMSDELEQNKSSLDRQRLLQNEQLSSNPSQDRKLQDLQTELRSMVQDSFDGITHEIERRGIKSLQAGGDIDKIIKQLADELEPENLNQMLSNDRIKLTLTHDKTNVFGSVINEAVSNHVRNDLSYVKSKSNSLMNEVNQQLSRQIKNAPNLRNLGLHPSRFENDVGMLGQVDINYRGEIPRMTLGKRFSSARSWMMPAMLGAMLIGAVITISGGSSSSDIRNLIYVLMIPLLIAGFAWTFISQKKEEESHLLRELDRVRGGVLQQMRRVVTDMLRKEQQLLRDHFQKNAREITNQLGSIIREEEQRRGASTREGQQRTQRTMRTVEQKIRDNQQSITEVERLIIKVRELEPDIIETAIKSMKGINI